MSSNNKQKWSSSTSLTKFFSRITRTLSLSSKKHQQSSKKNDKPVQQSQPIFKNNLFVPKSVPVIRRYPPQPISKILYNDDMIQKNHYREGVHVNIHDQSDDDDDDDDDSRYSLHPNLSLFNISTDNVHYQSEDYYQQVPQQQKNDRLDDIFHSTKIEHY